MDMFLLFAVIFVCVMFGLGISALALSLLFRLMLRMAGARPAVTVPATAGSQAPNA
jgi:hypothetical protein